MHNAMIEWLSAIGAAAAAVLFSADAQGPKAPVTLTLTTETLVAVGTNLSLPGSSGKAVVDAWVALSLGADATAVTVSIYRGAVIAGAPLGTHTASTDGIAAGTEVALTIKVLDVLDNIGGTQYCMSAQQTGATGDATVLNAIIETELLSG